MMSFSEAIICTWLVNTVQKQTTLNKLISASLVRCSSSNHSLKNKPAKQLSMV